MNRSLHFLGTECGNLRAAGANPSFTKSKEREEQTKSDSLFCFGKKPSEKNEFEANHY